jgi:hypothetical protein
MGRGINNPITISMLADLVAYDRYGGRINCSGRHFSVLTNDQAPLGIS